MKKLVGVWMLGTMITIGFAQKIDDARMERDIEVAENVLKTLIRQQFDKQRMVFGVDVQGSYQQGFGVTFRLPADFTTPITFALSGEIEDVMWIDGQKPGTYSYSYTTPESTKGKMARESEKIAKDMERVESEKMRLEGKIANRRVLNMDSARQANNEKLIKAAKDFLVDYGDLISQLSPTERIVITNRGEQPRIWVGQFFSAPKRTHLSVELSMADITAHKQNKLTREQALEKITVVNTETVESVEPDLELLSSIFNRLYRSDLSTTFFTDEGIYYERLKEFGAVYYMNVYSSHQSRNSNFFNMPTVNLNEVDQATRDKKVKEMYPAFEKELKENLVEYGRTVKSLQDNESLVVNVRLTKCTGCAIPSSIELSVKSSVLKDYSAGKVTKDVALSKVIVKKGQNQ